MTITEGNPLQTRTCSSFHINILHILMLKNLRLSSKKNQNFLYSTKPLQAIFNY